MQTVYVLICDHKHGRNVQAFVSEGCALVEKSNIEAEDTFCEDTDSVEIHALPVQILTEQGSEVFNG